MVEILYITKERFVQNNIKNNILNILAIFDVIADNLKFIPKNINLKKIDEETAKRIHSMFFDILEKYKDLDTIIPPYDNNFNKEKLIYEVQENVLFLNNENENVTRASLNKVFKILDVLVSSRINIIESKNSALNLTEQILAALLFLGNKINFVPEEDETKYGNYVRNEDNRIFKCGIPHIMGHTTNGLNKSHTHLGYNGANFHILFSK